MTTIAYDGKLLCTDSQCNGGYIHQKPHQKLFVFQEERCKAVALCGGFGNYGAMIEWVQGGERPALGSDDACSAIAVYGNGEIWNFDSRDLGPVKIMDADADADGSGCQFAIAAMMAGASAFQAVEIASKLDDKTGGPIQCYDIQTKTLTGPFSG